MGQGLLPLQGLSPSPNLCFSQTQLWCELAVWAVTLPDFIGHALFSKAVCREDLAKGSWEVISWQISAQMNPHVVPVGIPFIHQPVQMPVKATLLPFELGAFQVVSCMSFLLWLLHFYSFFLERLVAFCNCMSFFPFHEDFFSLEVPNILQKVKVESFCFALNQLRAWQLQAPKQWGCGQRKHNGKEKQRSDFLNCETLQTGTFHISPAVSVSIQQQINNAQQAVVPFLHFNLCGSFWHQESSSARKMEWFLQGLYCSCPTLLPKINSWGGWGFNFTSWRIRTQTFVFSLAAPPTTMLKAVLFSWLFHTLISSGFAMVLWLLSIGRFPFPGQRKQEGKKVPISASGWQRSVLETHPFNHCMEQGQIFMKRSSQRGWGGKYIN